MALRIKLNPAGVRALLRSPEVQADLLKRGARIASAAGPDHEVETTLGRNRARVTVRTTSDAAAIAEQAHKTLTDAIDKGR